MILTVRHSNRFTYLTDVSLARHVLHLTPRATPAQVCHRHTVSVDPAPDVTSRRTDFFGNTTQFLTIQAPHRTLTITAESVVEVTPVTAPDPGATIPWDAVHEAVSSDLSPEGLDAYEMTFDSPYVTAETDLAAYARDSFPADRPVLAAALDLTARIHADFRYDTDATTIDTPVDEVFAARHGVCQDFAHLQVACLRQLGLAARYVSGYLLTLPPEGRERLVGADASHAWVSLWCPGNGWVDLDPTNNKIPGDEYVTLAWGRDYGDVSPVRGVVVGGAEQDLEVAVDVVPADSVEAAAARPVLV